MTNFSDKDSEDSQIEDLPEIFICDLEKTLYATWELDQGVYVHSVYVSICEAGDYFLSGYTKLNINYIYKDQWERFPFHVIIEDEELNQMGRYSCVCKIRALVQNIADDIAKRPYFKKITYTF